jgi:hypothetical protein
MLINCDSGVVQVVEQSGTVVEVVEQIGTVVEVVTAGPQGPDGEAGSAATISSDPENQIMTGSDGGIFSPPPRLATTDW